MGFGSLWAIVLDGSKKEAENETRTCLARRYTGGLLEVVQLTVCTSVGPRCQALGPFTSLW